MSNTLPASLHNDALVLRWTKSTLSLVSPRCLSLCLGSLYLSLWKRTLISYLHMVGWRHLLSGHEFGSTLGVGDGQGGLAGCSPWGRKELDMTEQLNWTEHNPMCIENKGFEGKKRRDCWEFLQFKSPLLYMKEISSFPNTEQSTVVKRVVK